MTRSLLVLGVVLAVGSLVWLAVGHRDATDGGGASRREAVDDRDAVPPDPGSSATLPSRPVPAPVLRGRPPVDTPLAEDEGGLFGVVLHATTGAPVAGVRVYALRLDVRYTTYHLLGSGTSDERGRYRLRGLSQYPMAVLLLGFGSGFVSDIVWPGGSGLREGWPFSLRAEVREGAWASHDVRVRPAPQAEGTVFLPDGAPAVGAEVRVAPSIVFGPSAWHALPPAVTDAGGRYVIDAHPSASSFGLEARLDGYLPVFADAAELPSGERGQVDLRFAPPHRAVIEVVQGETEEPLAGADVLFQWLRYGRSSGSLEETLVTTDDRGRALLAPVPHDGFQVEVRKGGFLPLGFAEDEGWRDVAAQTAPGLWTGRVALAALAWIEGRVEWPPDVTPPKGGWVQLRSSTFLELPGDSRVEPDADGSFRVSAPPEGAYTLVFQLTGEAGDWAATADVEAGATGVVLRPKCTRVRAVADRSGWGLWRLTLRDAERRPLVRTLVEREGAAVADVLTTAPHEGLEEGLLEVRVAPGDEPAWLSLRYAKNVDGESLPRLLVGPLGPEGGERDVVFPSPRTIRGRVLDSGDRPLQGVEVEAVPVVSPLLPYLQRDTRALTDADGWFVLRRLLHTTYDVVVKPCGSWILPPPPRVKAGAADLVLRLRAPTRKTIRVLDESGAAIHRASVWLRQRDGLRGPDADYEGHQRWTERDGTARFEGLDAAGVFELRVEVPRDRPDLLWWWQAGWTPRDETVVLRTGFRVEGAVLDEADRAMMDVEVWLHPSGGRRVTALTNDEGRFSFEGVAAGAVRLGAFFREVRPHDWRPELTIEANAGDCEVVLRLDSTRDLLVRVEAYDDEPVGLRTLCLTPTEADAPGARKLVRLSERGVARFRGLEPGRRYRLWGGPTEEGRYVLAEIGPTDTSVGASLAAGGEIEGRLLLPTGADRFGVKIVQRGIHCHARLLPDDRFRMVGVPPGDWTLEGWCTVEGERRSVRVTARTGETPTFDLTVP